MNSRSIDEPGSPAEPIAGGSRSDLWQSGLLWTRNARNHWHLTKPKVVGAIVFTAVVGMMPAVGIWLAAAAAATLNHLLDRRRDREMMRTGGRPLPQNKWTVH